MRKGSARFRLLSRHLRALREELLPRAFSPTGSYSERQLSRAVAYRVLAHAEIEAFLEERAKSIAISATKGWKRTGRPCRALVALAAFRTNALASLAESLAPSEPTQSKVWPQRLELDERIELSVTEFMTAIRENHGVKEKNILALLLPIGFPASRLDPGWLAGMNSFGESRGEAAHTSRVRQAVDPKSELATVSSLLGGLAIVDLELDGLLR